MQSDFIQKGSFWLLYFGKCRKATTEAGRNTASTLIMIEKERKGGREGGGNDGGLGWVRVVAVGVCGKHTVYVLQVTSDRIYYNKMWSLREKKKLRVLCKTPKILALTIGECCQTQKLGEQCRSNFGRLSKNFQLGQFSLNGHITYLQKKLYFNI